MFAVEESTELHVPGRRAAWLDALNPEQRAAATHPAEQLLILAGAGTGKTTTLCARVAWLVMDQGIAPERIMLLTFTRRAAREMLQRTRAIGAVPAGRRGVFGGTFHSVAHRFVRTHLASLGLTGSMTVLDAGDAADVIDLIREEQGYAQQRARFPKKSTLLDIYSRTVNFQTPLSEVIAGTFPWCEEHTEAIAGLLKAYAARKRALGALDLDDLLLYWRALVADEVLGRAIAGDFDHVLIDEYQDVNGIQVEIVRALADNGVRVTAVGDDLQAIYGWRSSSPRHILGFTDAFAGASVCALERNYRSAQPILDTANALGAQADRMFATRLHSERKEGAPPELVFCRDESAQAADVCARVLEAREQGMELRRQAVLMRTSHDSDLLELELARRQIPFVKYGGLKYLETAHVKDLVALMRLVENPRNELAWFRVLQLIEGVGPVSARRALDVLVTTGDPEAAGPEAVERLPAPARPVAESLFGALRAARAQAGAGAGTGTGAGTVTGAGAGAGIGAGAGADPSASVQAELLRDAIRPLIESRYPDAPVRLADLDQLVAAARESPGLGHFVSELALDPPQSSADLAGPPHLDEDYLVLSTVHSAKGLEWDAVHVLAVYDGNFPACMSAGSSETIAEERRLLYVAVTRARRRLHMYVPVRYYHRPGGSDDAHGYGKPSRFLTPEVRATCQVVRPPEELGPRPRADSPRRKITVSVDALLR
jgi:ATP-dependent DNA helicase UvrD/PcrA